MSHQQATEYLEQLANTKKNNPLVPPNEQLQKIESYMKKIAARQESKDNDIIRNLINKLYDYSNILMIYTKDGKRIYIQEEPSPRLGTTTLRFKKYTDLNFIETKNGNIEIKEIGNDPVGTSFDFASPQSRFVRTAIDKLNDIKPDNWDMTFVELIDRLQNDKTMGPIVKYYLMKMLFKTATETSFIFTRTFEKELSEFENIKFDFLSNYVDPEDLSANQARDICNNGFSNIPPFLEKLGELNDVRSKWKTANAGSQYDWFGVLFRDDNKEFTLLYDKKFYPPEKLKGDLYIIQKTQTENTLKYIKVGSATGGVFNINSNNNFGDVSQEKIFLEGKPVYITKDSN